MKQFLRPLLFIIPITAVLFWGAGYVYENRLYGPVSNWIGEDTKTFLKNTVLVFQTKAALEDEVADLERRLERTDDVQQLFEIALRNNPNLPDRIPFSIVTEQRFETGRDRFSMVSFESPFIPLDYFGRRAYLEVHDDDLLIITAKGTLGRIPIADIKGDGFSMQALKSNLPDLIENPEFYELSELSIKDALVVGDRLLLSYSKLTEPGCITIAIATADLGSERLTFEDILVPDQCVAQDNPYGEFSGNQSGGRMVWIGADRLLLSTGEMRFRDLAQDPDSFFGKVLEIDLSDGSWVVKSMGHRNPQGLYYDAEANVIVVSEHGPFGGDEININRSPTGAPENYGWPISSGGEHYTTDQATYDKAPLHKSHADYGFIEPDLGFTPSISPSQIVRMGPDPRDPDRYALMLGTMGFDYREGDESLHILELDRDFRITARDRIVLDDRVRDIVTLPGTNRYALYLEGDSYELGTIALLSVTNPTDATPD